MKEFILVVDDDKDICRLLGIYLGLSLIHI